MFEAIADLEASKGWYGSTDNTQQALADRARELGADAVLRHEELARAFCRGLGVALFFWQGSQATR
jgi:hypothetical protein